MFFFVSESLSMKETVLCKRYYRAASHFSFEQRIFFAACNFTDSWKQTSWHDWKNEGSSSPYRYQVAKILSVILICKEQLHLLSTQTHLTALCCARSCSLVQSFSLSLPLPLYGRKSLAFACAPLTALTAARMERSFVVPSTSFLLVTISNPLKNAKKPTGRLLICKVPSHLLSCFSSSK